MTTYYHVTGLTLIKGEVIAPGTLERALMEHFSTGPQGDIGNFAALSKELIFDDVRKHFFADKPSRFEVNFLFDDLHAAKKYGMYLCPHGIIYEVSIVKADAKMHRGDLANFQAHTVQHQHSFMEFYLKSAVDYWQGRLQYRKDADGTLKIQEEFEFAEILTESPICIERKVQLVNDPVQTSLDKSPLLN